MVAFSIDPDETPELAGPKKAAYLEQYDRPGSANGWHFLTGDQPSITGLAEAIGFRYTFNPSTKLYAHAAGVVIVTPDGQSPAISTGSISLPGSWRASCERARAGRIGTPIGRLLLALLRLRRGDRQVHAFDLAADPGPGTATAVALAGFMFVMFRREGRERRNEASES